MQNKSEKPMRKVARGRIHDIQNFGSMYLRSLFSLFVEGNCPMCPSRITIRVAGDRSYLLKYAKYLIRVYRKSTT